MKNYLRLQTKGFTYTSTTRSRKPFTKGISTLTNCMSTRNAKKVAVICIECLKIGIQVGLGAEAGLK